MSKRESSTSNYFGARFGVPNSACLLGCLLLVACDRGMDVTGVSVGNFTDPLTVELRGSEPAAFEVTLNLWTSKPVSARAEIHVEASRPSYYNASALVVMSFACEGAAGVDAVELFARETFRHVRVSTPAASPGEMRCVVTFTS